MTRHRKKTAAGPREGSRTHAVRVHLLAVAALVVSIAAAYSNSLDATWALDDVIAHKPVAMSDILDLVGFRKVAAVTFVLNQHIMPFSPVSFRVFNIFIHILATLCVYLLALRTFRLHSSAHIPADRSAGAMREDGPSGQRSLYAALLSGLVFGLHPLNTNAVTYVVQRMTSLAALFVLISLLCYIAGTLGKSTEKRLFWYLLAGASIVLGVFSKENAVMAIPLLLLYDFIFISRLEARRFFRRAAVIAGIGVVALAAATFGLRLHAAAVELIGFFLSPDQPLTYRGWMASDVYWTPLQHILTEFRVVARYLLLVVAPLPQFLVFDWWGFPVSQGILKPPTTLLSGMLVVSMTAGACAMMRRVPLLSFGVLWYLIAVSLESFIALGADLYFEHRNYLPLAGLVIGIVGQAVHSLRRPAGARSFAAAAFLIAAVLAGLTLMRNHTWRDSVTLWADTLSKAPSNPRAANAMGNAYMRLWDINNAEKLYREVVRVSAGRGWARFFDDASYSLGMIYLFTRQMDKAGEVIDAYERTVESHRPEILRGLQKAQNDDFEGALAHYRGVVGKTAALDSAVVHTLMGDAYHKTGAQEQALVHYRNAVRLDPGFAPAYHGMGTVYMSMRDVDSAAEYFRKTLTLDPYNVFALSDLSDLALVTASDGQEALRYAERAVSHAPPYYQAYLSMANALLYLGKERDADEFYGDARTRGMAPYMIPFAKARVYLMKGDKEKSAYYVRELRSMKDLPHNIRRMVE